LPQCSVLTVSKKPAFTKDAFADGQEEGCEEIQRKGVAELLKLGLDAEQIARSLSLPLATTKKMIQAAKGKS
jgi:hypothetical protein